MSEINRKTMVMTAGVLAFILCILVSFGCGKRYALNRLVLPQEPRVDTLVIRDTITSEKPIYKERRVAERVLVPVRDTIRITDTLYMYAAKEQVHWRDSLSDVYATGIGVRVDSVIHYVPTRVVTKERDVMVKVKPRWSIGVQAGYGAHFSNGQVLSAPYVGVGVQYNIFSW